MKTAEGIEQEAHLQVVDAAGPAVAKEYATGEQSRVLVAGTVAGADISEVSRVE